MPRNRKPRQSQSLKKIEQHVDRIEKSMLKRDVRSEWIKSNNMKQYSVTLKDVILLEQVQVGGASTFTGQCILTPNSLRYSLTGGSGTRLPQPAIWEEYAQLYEFYMVERIELKYYPTILRVETTTTGTQDTAILPTASGHIPESSSTVTGFFQPALNYVTAANQVSNLMARKSGCLHEGQSPVVVRSQVSNTLLLKQDAPMLRTNGSVASREQYGDEAGACVIVPSRPPTDRVPFGYLQFSITYRFAGRVQPGVASTKSETKHSVVELRQMLAAAMLEEAQDEVEKVTHSARQASTPM